MKVFQISWYLKMALLPSSENKNLAGGQTPIASANVQWVAAGPV